MPRTLVVQGPNLQDRVVAQRTLQRAEWHLLPTREGRWLQIALESSVQEMGFGIDMPPRSPSFRISVSNTINTSLQVSKL